MKCKLLLLLLLLLKFLNSEYNVILQKFGVLTFHNFLRGDLKQIYDIIFLYNNSNKNLRYINQTKQLETCS
jgi:hypothetical protein